MKQNILETLVGFIVIIIALGFFAFAYRLSNVSQKKDGYILYANFQDIDGIVEGADIKLSGIKIGYVDSIKLNQETYYADAKFYIEKDTAIPVDSNAIVATSGLLGGKYIRITAGGSDKMFTNQGKIKFTQSSLNIEDLIGKLMYSLTNK